MKNIVLLFFLLTISSFSQYGTRYLQDDQVVLAASQDTVITFTNAWYNVSVYTLDTGVEIELGDTNTTLDSVTVRMIHNVPFVLTEKTPLKKCYIENTNGEGSVTVYFVGDKSVAE